MLFLNAAQLYKELERVKNNHKAKYKSIKRPPFNYFLMANLSPDITNQTI